MGDALQEVLEVYNEERLLVAQDKIVELAKQDEWKDDPEVQKWHTIINEEANKVRSAKKYIEDVDSWICAIKEKTYKVNYRTHADSGLCSFMMETVLQSSMPNAMAILAEINLFHHWLPRIGNLGLLHCDELERQGRCRKTAFLSFGMPWPFANRSFLARGYACNMLKEDGTALALLESVENVEGVQAPDEGDQSIVRGEIVWGVCLYHPITTTTTRMSLVLDVDIKMALVPTAIINLATKHIFAHACVTIQKLVTNMPQDYVDAMAANPDLYEFLQRLTVEYYENHHQDREEGDEEGEGEEGGAKHDSDVDGVD